MQSTVGVNRPLIMRISNQSETVQLGPVLSHLEQFEGPVEIKKICERLFLFKSFKYYSTVFFVPAKIKFTLLITGIRN